MKINYNGRVIGTIDQRSYSTFRSHRYGGKRKTTVRAVVPRKLRKVSRSRITRVGKIVKLGVLTVWAGTLLFAAYADYCNKHWPEIVTTPKVEASQVSKQEVIPQGDYFDKYFGEEANLARAICHAESNLNSDAANTTLNKDKSSDWGICQVNLEAHWKKIYGDSRGEKIRWLLNPDYNVAFSKTVRDSEGWTAWTCYNNGSYLKYLEN